MLIARIANAIAAFFGYRVGAIAMQDVKIESVMIRQMPHTGNEGVLKGAVISPFGGNRSGCENLTEAW